MIVDSDHNSLTMKQGADSPPSYDDATESGSTSSPSVNPATYPHQQKSGDPSQPLIPHELPADASFPYSTQPPPFTPPPTIYNYVNPVTGERVVSLLPPDHPEMVCLQAGEHVPHTHYGVLGVLAAIFWFPLGIGLCLLDRRVRCARCGLIIDGGMCYSA